MVRKFTKSSFDDSTYFAYIYTNKVRIGFRGRCWVTVQYEITIVDPSFKRFECCKSTAYHSSMQPNTQHTQIITSPTTRDGDQEERHHFAVVRLQQQQRWILHWSGISVPVIEQTLDTTTRTQEEDGEGKERRSIGKDLRWLVDSFFFHRLHERFICPCCVRGTFRGSLPPRGIDVRACFLAWFLYTILPLTNMASIYLRVDRSCVTGTWS